MKSTAYEGSVCLAYWVNCSPRFRAISSGSVVGIYARSYEGEIFRPQGSLGFLLQGPVRNNHRISHSPMEAGPPVETQRQAGDDDDMQRMRLTCQLICPGPDRQYMYGTSRTLRRRFFPAPGLAILTWFPPIRPFLRTETRKRSLYPYSIPDLCTHAGKISFCKNSF